jgi:hypothetical protein
LLLAALLPALWLLAESPWALWQLLLELWLRLVLALVSCLSWAAPAAGRAAWCHTASSSWPQ